MKLLGESCLSLSPPLHRASQYPPVHAPTPSRWKPLLPFLMLSLMLGGTTQACYLPDRPSVAEQAYHSPVVVEGKVQGTGKAVAGAHVRFSLAVRVTDVWSTRNDDLSRGSILMVGDFGSEAPCIRPRRNQRYIFFLQPPTLSTSLASLEPSSTSAYSPSSLPSLQSLMVSSSHSPSFIASDSPPSLHTFRPTPNTVNGSQSAWPVAENTSDAPATGRPRHGDEGHWRGAVYRSLYAPRESVSRGHNVKRQVNSILCEQCGTLQEAHRLASHDGCV
uniref:Neuregulin 2 N-terminal domain-containing protein n=1 Tax=Eptatretus burgeri TaxID=7764 RepID=A0A8C4QW40_EPTBU